LVEDVEITPTESHTMHLSSQSGAMFGLDARIALAIFGLLSVVAGVAAINVFSQAGVTALNTELQNMKKAYTEFHLATGEHTAKFSDLIKNDSGFMGWNGPYIDGMLSTKSRLYGEYSLMEGRIDVNGVPPVECTGGICGTWLKLTKVKDSLAKAAHAEMNGDDGNLAGGVLRVELTPGPTDDLYFLIGNRPASGASTAE
jgi:hypothetical protein